MVPFLVGISSIHNYLPNPSYRCIGGTTQTRMAAGLRNQELIQQMVTNNACIQNLIGKTIYSSTNKGFR